MCAQAYSALLHAAVKCGETDLAVDVYEQMKGEGMPRDRAIHVTMIEMFLKLGRVSDALAALGELHAIGEPPDTHLYNLVLVAATKLGPPRFALTVYHRCDSVPLRQLSNKFSHRNPASSFAKETSELTRVTQRVRRETSRRDCITLYAGWWLTVRYQTQRPSQP